VIERAVGPIIIMYAAQLRNVRPHPAVTNTSASAIPTRASGTSVCYSAGAWAVDAATGTLTNDPEERIDMATKTLPSRALVRELLHYDVVTGQFTWLPRSREMFVSNNAFRTWNNRYTGKIAGTLSLAGHLRIAIGHTQYRAHRLVWLYVHGEPVPDVIDHIDHDKLNNRFSNLRAATKRQNGANSGKRKNNTTGIKGVGRWKGYYRARIMFDGKDISLGYFKTLEEAAKARFEAASRLHGEFARHE
jgi:hypothetical protein